MLPLTFWMNMPSFHQDGLFNALVDSGEVDLQVVFAHNLAAEREQLGWKSGIKKYPYRTLSQTNSLMDGMRIAHAQRRRLHIINGIWAEPAFAAALCMLVSARSQFAIHSEAPDPEQRPSAFKKTVRSSFAKWVAGRAAGLFAVSHFATDFYLQLGFAPAHVYPFAYFRGGTNLAVEYSQSKNPLQIDIVFVGQLIHRKGIDILLAAMSPLFAKYPELKLSIIGNGEDAAALKKQAASLGIAERVQFAGVLSSDETPRRIAQANLLVLPSRWDGWGMVVNEALAVGVPVIVSNRCGAADLIQPGINGFIFRSEDVEDLRSALRQFLENRSQWPTLYGAARLVGQSLSTEKAAHYLIDCLRHLTHTSGARPIPPWTPIPLSQSTKF